MTILLFINLSLAPSPRTKELRDNFQISTITPNRRPKLESTSNRSLPIELSDNEGDYQAFGNRNPTKISTELRLDVVR